MANGEVLSQLQQLLDSDNTIPQNVTNGLILAAVREIYKQGVDLKGCVERLSNDLMAVKRERDIEKAHNLERVVTWPSLWQDFGKEIIKYVLVALLAIAIAKLFGNIP